jgi:alpha-tubulin suppressor-like RCC1 family protein
MITRFRCPPAIPFVSVGVLVDQLLAGLSFRLGRRGLLMATALVASCASPAPVVAITAGSGYTCALISGGTVECWGGNSSGELGTGDTGDSRTPVTVEGVNGASSVVAGLNHACAITSTGTVECWGDNARGQLGSGTPGQAMPIRVSGLPTASAITAGDDYTCAMTTDGDVKCWGMNDFGQLGVSTVQVHNSALPVAVDGLRGATKISARGDSACALLEDGSVKCWGLNLSGQLGNGTYRGPEICRPFAPAPCSPTPVVASLLTDSTSVSTGASHSCALGSDGSVACWGDNRAGQLGTGDAEGPERCGEDFFNGLSAGACSTLPIAVADLSQVIAIATGNGFTCSLTARGVVRCWGLNELGQLGNGTTTDSPSPTTVQGLTGVTSIAAGEDHACALLSDGEVACWGSNAHGALGHAGTNASPVPVKVIR